MRTFALSKEEMYQFKLSYKCASNARLSARAIYILYLLICDFFRYVKENKNMLPFINIIISIMIDCSIAELETVRLGKCDV